MSCTVIAVPYALMWIVAAVTTAAVSGVASNNKVKEFNEFVNQNFSNINSENNENCTEDIVITEKHFIEKTFETPFMDYEILKKTITEHGATNIIEWEDELSCEVDNYKLVFEKPSSDKPYNVRISCLENQKAEEKMGDLNNEYAMNVQEDAYLHILDKLKENNMEIAEEEVMDDNTIVLTINID